MKRETFVKAIDMYNAKLVRTLTIQGVEPDVAADVVQDMVASMLANKSYKKFEGDSLGTEALSFLKQATRLHLWNANQKQDLQSSIFVSIDSEPEKERVERADTRTKQKEERECPYCHDGTLRVHGPKRKLSITCAECCTVLGQGKKERENVSVDEKDLFEWPNLDLRIDVQKALLLLTDFERKVVEAIVNGTESLDGIANVEGMGERDLYKVYAGAKAKLRSALVEYE